MTEHEARPRGWGRLAILILGSFAALLVIDAGVGALIRRQWPPTEPAAVADSVNFSGDDAAVVDDPRADLPALADAPWAQDFYQELQRTPHAYWPFTESRPLDFDGEYINVQNWARATYRSPDATATSPVIWLFGGSTAFGEGQRDEYTIASWLARIAEETGTPVTVVNYGQRGWTHFQEMLLFEQLAAAGPPPDIAVFYDGANEINAQSLSAKGVPSHVLADQYAARISGGLADPERENVARPGSWARVWEAYVDASAVHRVVSEIDDRLFATAGAAGTQDGGGTGAGSGGTGAGDGDGATSVYVTTIDDAKAAVDVYERGRALTEHLAERYGVEPVFIWQPLIPNAAEQWAADNVSDPTVNLADALADHPEVFIDGAHTNERGAELVARRIWDQIAPDVEAVSDPDRAPRADRPTTTTTTTTPPPDNAAIIESAAAKLDEAGDDPCVIEAWKVWAGNLRADDPTQAQRIALLTQRYLFALVAAAPPDQAAAAAEVRAAAEQLPLLAAAVTNDPKRPFIPQLPIIDDPASTFLPAFQSLSESIADECGPGGPR